MPLRSNIKFYDNNYFLPIPLVSGALHWMAGFIEEEEESVFEIDPLRIDFLKARNPEKKHHQITQRRKNIIKQRIHQQTQRRKTSSNNENSSNQRPKEEKPSGASPSLRSSLLG